jgi:hypothetical protein
VINSPISQLVNSMDTADVDYITNTEFKSQSPSQSNDADVLESVPLPLDCKLANLVFIDEFRTLETPLFIKTGSAGGTIVLKLGKFTSASSYPKGFECHVRFYDFESPQNHLTYHALIAQNGRYEIRPVSKEGPVWSADTATTMFKLLAAACKKQGSYSLSGPRKMGLTALTNLFAEMFAIDQPGQLMSTKATGTAKKKRKVENDDYNDDAWSSQYDSPLAGRANKRPSRAGKRDIVDATYEPEIQDYRLPDYTAQDTSDDETDDGLWRFAGSHHDLPVLYSTDEFYPPSTRPAQRNSARTEAAQALSCLTEVDQEAITALQGLASCGTEGMAEKQALFGNGRVSLLHDFKRINRNLEDLFHNMWTRQLQAEHADETMRMDVQMRVLLSKMEECIKEASTSPVMTDSESGNTRVNL